MCFHLFICCILYCFQIFTSHRSYCFDETSRPKKKPLVKAVAPPVQLAPSKPLVLEKKEKKQSTFDEKMINDEKNENKKKNIETEEKNKVIQV